MPGTVLRVLVSEGDTVTAHQPLLARGDEDGDARDVTARGDLVRHLAAEGDQAAAGEKLVELED